jgi:hypothetical protein
MRSNLEQNKECLIALSRFKFSLVINGLTDILKTIDNTVRKENCFVYFHKQFFFCIEMWRL